MRLARRDPRNDVVKAYAAPALAEHLRNVDGQVDPELEASALGPSREASDADVTPYSTGQETFFAWHRADHGLG
jgi:hypothetical protein